MGIWKNFKAADHNVETGILIALLAVAFCVGLFFIIDKTSQNFPDLRGLFVQNGRYFRWFLFSAAGLFIFSYMTYVGSLDFWDAETRATVRASIIAAVLWAIMWTVWGIYCGWLTITYSPLTTLVKGVIGVLVIFPSLIAFLVSRNIRQQQLKQNDSSGAEHYIICVDKKYYSGYYGLLCPLAYLCCLLVADMFDLW